MDESINLEEAVELAQGPKEKEWEEITQDLYSTTVRHPNYEEIEIRIKKLGTGTAFTLSINHDKKQLASWSGDIQPARTNYSVNTFKSIYEQAKRRTNKKESRWWLYK